MKTAILLAIAVVILSSFPLFIPRTVTSSRQSAATSAAVGQDNASASTSQVAYANVDSPDKPSHSGTR